MDTNAFHSLTSEVSQRTIISEEIKHSHIDIPWRWSYRWSSYAWLRHMMYGIILLMCSILLFSVADIFHLINIR